jgi:hypothetical protein
MPKYQVKALEVHAVIIDVEAESEQEAQAKAEEILANGCYEDGRDVPDAVYDTTVGRDEWRVWEA